MAKRKPSTALTWIIAEAKRIRRASPGKKWITCTKEASARYRARHSGGSKPAKKKKRVGAHRARPRAKKRSVGYTLAPMTGQSAIGRAGAGELRGELRRRIKDRIDKAVVRKYHATKKREKRKIQKSITAAKSELRRLG